LVWRGRSDGLKLQAVDIAGRRSVLRLIDGSGLRAAGDSRVAAPILMYHVIAAAPSTAPFPGLYVTPQDFRRQMDALDAAGFRAVTLDELHAAWDGRARLPRRPVVITLDNGYRSQYTQALPILRRLGWVPHETLH